MKKKTAPINHGGQAFPTPATRKPNGEHRDGVEGMTLRAYFASQAIGHAGDIPAGHEALYATRAVEVADALISALNLS